MILQLLIAVANTTPAALTSIFGTYYKYLKILSFESGRTGSNGLGFGSMLPAITAPLAEHDSPKVNRKDCLDFPLSTIILILV